MMTTKFVTAAFVTVGLAVAPLAAGREELHVFEARCLDNAVCRLWGDRTVDTAIRDLWDIRHLCRNCHRTLSGVVQLAFGGCDKRSAHLAQHQSSRSQVARTAVTSRSSLRRQAPPSMSVDRH